MEATQRMDASDDKVLEKAGENENSRVQYGILRIISAAALEADVKESREFKVFGGVTKIGRDPGRCNIVIASKTLSRVHAILDIDDVSSMTLHDNHSLNKTLRNGVQLKPAVRYSIVGGETITLGEIVTKFEVVARGGLNEGSFLAPTPNSLPRSDGACTTMEKLEIPMKNHIFEMDTQQVDNVYDLDTQLVAETVLKHDRVVIDTEAQAVLRFDLGSFSAKRDTTNDDQHEVQKMQSDNKSEALDDIREDFQHMENDDRYLAETQPISDELEESDKNGTRNSNAEQCDLNSSTASEDLLGENLSLLCSTPKKGKEAECSFSDTSTPTQLIKDISNNLEYNAHHKASMFFASNNAAVIGENLENTKVIDIESDEEIVASSQNSIVDETNFTCMPMELTKSASNRISYQKQASNNIREYKFMHSLEKNTENDDQSASVNEVPVSALQVHREMYTTSEDIPGGSFGKPDVQEDGVTQKYLSFKKKIVRRSKKEQKERNSTSETFDLDTVRELSPIDSEGDHSGQDQGSEPLILPSTQALIGGLNNITDFEADEFEEANVNLQRIVSTVNDFNAENGCSEETLVKRRGRHKRDKKTNQLNETKKQITKIRLRKQRKKSGEGSLKQEPAIKAEGIQSHKKITPSSANDASSFINMQGDKGKPILDHVLTKSVQIKSDVRRSTRQEKQSSRLLEASPTKLRNSTSSDYEENIGRKKEREPRKSKNEGRKRKISDTSEFIAKSPKTSKPVVESNIKAQYTPEGISQLKIGSLRRGKTGKAANYAPSLMNKIKKEAVDESGEKTKKFKQIISALSKKQTRQKITSAIHVDINSPTEDTKIDAKYKSFKVKDEVDLKLLLKNDKTTNDHDSVSLSRRTRQKDDSTALLKNPAQFSSCHNVRKTSSFSTAALNSSVTSTFSTTSKGRRKLQFFVMFTGMDNPQDKKIVTDLGGHITDSLEECTVLVTDKVRRTTKFMCMVGKGVPIVTPLWLKMSKEIKCFQDPWLYIITDKESEKKWGFNLRTTLKSSVKPPLLTNLKIFATQSVIPPPQQLKDIVEFAGGQWLQSLPRKYADDVLVISCPEDKQLLTATIKKGVKIFDKEILLTGILKKDLDRKSHLLYSN